MSRHSLGLSPDLLSYLRDVGVREPESLARLRRRTHAMPGAQMQISPEQGALLAMLVQLTGATQVIEIGTFTGYSSLAMALALPANGRLRCIDIDPHVTSHAVEAWKAAGVADRVRLTIGPAAAELDQMILDGHEGTWDLAFVDADKTGYAGYVDQLHTLLRVGGVIALDNVLWSGRVVDLTDRSDDTIALRALNAALQEDQRWDLSMLPIGDGLTLLRKRG